MDNFDRIAKEMYNACVSYLRASGEVPEAPLIKAARAVVWARYSGGDDGWERLQQAIGQI